MTDDPILTPADVAEALRITPSQVLALARRGELAFVTLPSGRPLKPRRIHAWSVRRLLEGHNAADAESNRTPSTQEAPSGRGNRRAPQGPMASEAVGGSGAVPRRAGPGPQDVVVRRVEDAAERLGRAMG